MSFSEKKIDVTIIGSGFAGLSAALRLHQAGAKVQVIEKRPFFGGRAYSFREPKTGDIVDNGQHLLMGAYHETFAFLKALGTLDKLSFQDQLKVSYAFPGESQLKTLSCPKLPAPLHLTFGLLGFDGLKFKDKWGMARLIRFCQQHPRKRGFRSLDEITIAQLLKETQQTPEAIRVFWEPLVLATLNEPLSQASSEMFYNVLRLGLLSKCKDSRLAFPKVGFQELYTKPAETYLQDHNVPIHFQTQVHCIERAFYGAEWKMNTSDGKCVKSKHILLAVPPDELTRIIKNSPKNTLFFQEPMQKAFAHFQPSPIFSINLWFKDFLPPSSFIGLLDSPLHWLFHKAQILKGQTTNGANNYISVVISGAYELTKQNKSRLIKLALEELQRFYPELKEKQLIHSQVIKEYKATFSGRVNLISHRPRHDVDEGFYIAGDWTDLELPGTIESAVRSGHRAAEAIISST